MIMDRRKRQAIYALVLAAAVVSFVVFALNLEALSGDALDYYNFSKTLTDDAGHFSLSNFPWTIRGVSYAIYLNAVGQFADLLHVDIRYAVLLINYLLLTGTAYLYAETFCAPETDRRKLLAYAVAVTALFAALARYSVTALLTDLPAMCVEALGGLLLLRAYRKKRAAWLAGLVSGALLYTAYNFRTIYLMSAIALLCVFVIAALIEKNYRFFLPIVCALAGAFIAGLPQALVNYRLNDLFSIALSTATDPGRPSLFVNQLFWGLSVYRYDTYINISEVYDDFRLVFTWAGASGFDTEQVQYSLKGYLVLIMRNPIGFVALYISHFLNMLSPYFTQAYITDLLTVKWPYLVGMYTVCYVALWDILSKFQDRIYTIRSLTDKRFLVSLGLLLPALAIVPGAVEHRFGLPLFFLLFLYCACCCSYRRLWDKLKANPLGNVLLYAFLLMFMFNFWITTLASGPVPIPI